MNTIFNGQVLASKQKKSFKHCLFTGSLLLTLFVTFLSGCGGGPKVVEVTGTVTYQDKPVSNLLVHFKPENGRPSWGLTDKNGHYFLDYNRDRNGAIVGKHLVWVQFNDSGDPAAMTQSPGVIQRPNHFPPIHKKYLSQATTPLTFDVASNNRVFDIKLE